MSERKKLFEIRGLVTQFSTEAGLAKAVEDVNFDIYEGEVLGIVGESGSGKSVTALSLTRLIPNPPGEIVAGSVMYKGRDLLKLSYDELHKIRGKEVAMIFQEPMTSLNPVFTVGYQIREILALHEKLSKSEVRKRAIAMLDLVGIPDAEKRIDDYPHQFSGGMRQRAMIAMALACNPALLIADEPTTALDVTIQAQILELMLTVKEKRPEAAVMLITHDLAVVAETCERVIVMYGGRIQETAEVGELFEKPLHPYTQGLLRSLPRPGQKKEKLETIRGMVPSIFDMPAGCKYCTRCDLAEDRCFTEEPDLVEVRPGHEVRCHLVEVENDR
jgi:peptide/nickel transport system ATP-binding protein